MYIANEKRYENMKYDFCGKSGIRLPKVSLGFWHNFGGVDTLQNAREMVHAAFDLGITHFDLANNYGPPAGSAEETFGKILATDLKPYRDEMIISSKAGYYMWPGPYGDGGSKKYLISSLDQSLKRMGLDYVDIFYSHRPDNNTPLEETMEALALLHHQGKALYVGISNYPADRTKQAYDMLKSMGVKCFIHQPSYSMLNRWVEDGLLDVLEECGMGSIAFSPLAQGLLSDKYLKGIPEDSRAAKPTGFLQESSITPELVEKIQKLNGIASERGQTLAQMALCWVLKDKRITSVLIGASSAKQIKDNVQALDNLEFNDGELEKIEAILS